MLTHAEPPQRAESSTECWATGKTDGGEGWWLKNEGSVMSVLQKKQNVIMINDTTLCRWERIWGENISCVCQFLNSHMSSQNPVSMQYLFSYLSGSGFSAVRGEREGEES